MNKRILLGLSVIMLTATLSGCSQVHFGRDAVTIGSVKKITQKLNIKLLKMSQQYLAAVKSQLRKQLKRLRRLRLKMRIRKSLSRRPRN